LAAVPNFFRKPYGPGWALVGDAGYNKDFITAQGISDAFRDAELCATALDETFCGACSFEVAMARYRSTRDQHVLPMYEFTTQLATLEPPLPELLQLLGAVHGNPQAMDGFARVNAGVTSPAEFFSEENIRRILAPPGSHRPARTRPADTNRTDRHRALRASVGPTAGRGEVSQGVDGRCSTG
jgi:hypothetical protein